MNEKFDSYNRSSTWHTLLLEAQEVLNKWYPRKYNRIVKLSELSH
jgi:hypothetical protein